MFCDLLDFICTPKLSVKSKEDQHKQTRSPHQLHEEGKEGQNESHLCQQPLTNRHGLHRIYNEHLFNSFHGKLIAIAVRARDPKTFSL